jgi:hypothetical protein
MAERPGTMGRRAEHRDDGLVTTREPVKTTGPEAFPRFPTLDAALLAIASKTLDRTLW